LQVACVYGDLTRRLRQGIADIGGWLAVIDVLPIQLRDLQAKLPKIYRVRLLAMDLSDLRVRELHSQSKAARSPTLRTELFFELNQFQLQQIRHH
jgi:hypothetical protein